MQINEFMPKLLPVSFETMRVGSRPPRIGGVRVYDDEVSRGEVIMDIELFYAGNTVISIKAGPVRAGVRDVQLHGRLRVIFKPLVDQPPLIAGVTAFFLSTPDIAWDLTDLLGPLDAPYLSRMLKNAVLDQINANMVLPHKIQVPLLDDLKLVDLIFHPPGKTSIVNDDSSYDSEVL